MEKCFVFIGAGAVGSNLAVALKRAGEHIGQIISRSTESGQLLANEVDAVFSVRPEDMIKGVTHIFLTLPDHAIAEVLPMIPKLKAVIIHTSGSFRMTDLSTYGSDLGVLYPLQSFSKELDPEWEEIPFFIEASNSEIESDLRELVEKLGASSMLLDSEKRMKLHLAAVFASNFTNYLQGRAQKLIGEIGLSDDLIRPLVEETIRKSFDLGAIEAQTGPARRGDQDTIKKHLDLLSCCKMDMDIYKYLSDSISEEYKK